jgi:hypothetical protein
MISVSLLFEMHIVPLPSQGWDSELFLQEETMITAMIISRLIKSRFFFILFSLADAKIQVLSKKQNQWLKVYKMTEYFC